MLAFGAWFWSSASSNSKYDGVYDKAVKILETTSVGLQDFDRLVVNAIVGVVLQLLNLQPQRLIDERGWRPTLIRTKRRTRTRRRGWLRAASSCAASAPGGVRLTRAGGQGRESQRPKPRNAAQAFSFGGGGGGE